jgi:hypothetical protein
VFRADCRRLRDPIAAAVRRGLVQFTEPLRLTDLLPGFCLAAARYPGRPLRLIDIGACAGFHLAPECFAIRYPRAHWSPPQAAMTMTSELALPPWIMQHPWVIRDRIGIDQAPVDPRAPGALAYLRSFAWAGDPAREQRLVAALAAVTPRPPPILTGDVAEILPDVLADRVAPDALTLVIESATASYLPASARLRLGRLLDQSAGRGPLVMISRGGGVPNSAGLPGSVRLVDFSAHSVQVYAASDSLSERMQWLPRQAPDGI